MKEFDGLGNKAKMVDIALKYTGGDMDKAKAMALGQYMDTVVIKGKFLVPGVNHSGVFLAFFNTIQEFISNVSVGICSNQGFFHKTRIFDDWKIIWSDLLTCRSGSDAVDGQSLSEFMLDSFISKDVFPDVAENNLDRLSKACSEIIAKSYNADAVQSQIELDKTSSMMMEMSDVPLDAPPAEEPQKGAETAAEDDKFSKIESEADYVIEGKVIVSPVKGKYINDIQNGEKIRVILTGKDPVTRKILKVLNAYDADGNAMPIRGRIKEKIPLEKSGFTVYALVAKGVLVKILEEENVKIQLDRPEEETLEKGKEDSRLVFLISVLVGLIILSGIVLFIVL